MQEDAVMRRLEDLLVDLEVYENDKLESQKIKTHFLEVYNYYNKFYDLSEYKESANKIIKN